MALLCVLLHLTCKPPWFVIAVHLKLANELDVWLLPLCKSCDGAKESLPYFQGSFFVSVQCVGGGGSPIHQIHRQMLPPSCAEGVRNLAKQFLLCQATCGWSFLVSLVLCWDPVFTNDNKFHKGKWNLRKQLLQQRGSPVLFESARILAKPILLCQARCGWAFFISLALSRE